MQAGRQAGRQTDPQTDRPTDRLSDKQIRLGRQTNTHTHKTHTNTHTHTHTHTRTIVSVCLCALRCLVYGPALAQEIRALRNPWLVLYMMDGNMPAREHGENKALNPKPQTL